MFAQVSLALAYHQRLHRYVLQAKTSHFMLPTSNTTYANMFFTIGYIIIACAACVNTRHPNRHEKFKIGRNRYNYNIIRM